MQTLILIMNLLAVSGAAPDQAQLALLDQGLGVGPAAVVELTAYTDDPRENMGPGRPVITATGTRVRPGIVAVSRDLLRAGFAYGERVYIPGQGVFLIEDTMNTRICSTIDLAMNSKVKALEFGRVRQASAIVLSLP